MSSANVETPSKITDFFPPSPTSGDGKQHSKDVNSTADDSKDMSHLSNSSVLLTPESSPAKEEVATIVTDIAQKNTEKTPKCKKALSEESKLDTDPPEKTGSSATKSEPTKAASTPQPAQPKRRGRRKKGETIQLVSNGPVRPKSARKKKPEPEQKNRLVTDYFTVRRSDRRKTKTQIQKEQDEDLEYKLQNGIEDGLEVQEIANKGRGVVAMKVFKRGDFVVEYAGDLISVKEARRRDKDYSENPEMGCYMYYFSFKNKSYCIDATAESGKLGRLLNHSKTSGNCHTKLVDVKNKPYLILVASSDIKIGEELEYDYGDRSKSSLESHPWLKS